jgi:Transposase DDE domain
MASMLSKTPRAKTVFWTGLLIVPSKQPELYRIEAFDVNIEQRKAVCPQGKISTECSKLTEGGSGKVTYRFEFGRQCRNCLLKARCVPQGQPHRMIRVGALHEVLQQRRREQRTPEFKLRMQHRNGIEGTISELVRGHGLRRARYRGFAKADVQSQLIAAACNIKRWLQKLIKWSSEAGSETNLPFYRLLTCLTSLSGSSRFDFSARLIGFDVANLDIASSLHRSPKCRVLQRNRRFRSDPFVPLRFSKPLTSLPLVSL